MNDNKWPAWFYGPNGQSDVFESADEVPEGWQDHPSKVADAVTIATDTDANGAVLAPPDVITQCGLAIPLIGLYEISIIAARFVEPKPTEV